MLLTKSRKEHYLVMKSQELETTFENLYSHFFKVWVRLNNFNSWYLDGLSLNLVQFAHPFITTQNCWLSRLSEHKLFVLTQAATTNYHSRGSLHNRNLFLRVLKSGSPKIDASRLDVWKEPSSWRAGSHLCSMSSKVVGEAVKRVQNTLFSDWYLWISYSL